MAAVYTGGTKVKKIYIGGTKVKKAYAGDTKVYSSGNTVTYRVDSGVTYTEEADEGASCLSPATFTPTKSGWTFLGWREDGTASATVLSSKTMGEAAVTLYAVFRAAVTLSFTGNGSTSGSTAAKTGYRYYNNGSTVNPTLTFPANGFARTGYTWKTWALGGASGTQYAAGASVTLSAGSTAYALWTRDAVTYLSGATGYSITQGPSGSGVSIVTVDCTDFSTLTFTIKIDGSGMHHNMSAVRGILYAGLVGSKAGVRVYEIQWSESNSYFGETTTDDSPMGKGHDKTFTMDISAYSGDYTFGVWTGGSTSQMYASGNVSYVQCS